MSPIDLAIFLSRVEAICAEMGALLQRAALSPNIKDRLDFSCALFDQHGGLFAQAAHIPVHLGSMAYAMANIVEDVSWQPGDMLVVNDPFLGGTHLPDVTMIAPVFFNDGLVGFVANRAHHANIGAKAPGSMPLSKTLADEGLVIPPTMFMREEQILQERFEEITALPGADTSGDFAAQISANFAGIKRLSLLVDEMGADSFQLAIAETNRYGERLGKSSLEELPKGCYQFSDVMEDSGFGDTNIRICVRLDIAESIVVDFSGTSDQVDGNINCPLSVAAAAVYYAFRCLMPEDTPNCAGTYKHIEIKAPSGCLVNAQRPAATAAGNVETSMRIVDVVLGALAHALPQLIPAASQGTMNNVAMGNHATDQPWDYYETMGGGLGASAFGPGVSACQSHMTNTLNTPIESLESHYPLRIREYAIRERSGGAGAHRGGDGIIREFEFLAPADVTLLTERRTQSPWGLQGGECGTVGFQSLDGKPLKSKDQISVVEGQVLRVESPGGGGYGAQSPQAET